MKTIKQYLLAVMFLGVSINITLAQSDDKKTKTVYAEATINAPAARVWEAMVLDYGEISNFSPYIYTSGYIKGSLKGELNAKRKCAFNAKGTRWTHEQIMAIDHKKMIMKNVVIDAEKFPLNKDLSYAYYRVKDNSDGTSTASYEFIYRTDPGFMTGMVKDKFRKTLEGTIIGLKHYVETGEIINANTDNWKAILKKYKTQP